MNRKNIIASCLALMLGVSVASAQETFHGTVTYKYEIKGENAEMMVSFMPEAMVVKYGEQGMVTEMQGGMMAGLMGKIIVNNKNGEAFILNEGEKTVYLMKAEDLEDAEQPEVSKLEKMDESEEILGYDCQKYKMVSKQDGMEMTQYLWVTGKLKAPKIEVPGMQQLGSSVMTNAEIPGFPMRVEMTIPGMPAQIVMTAANLDFAKIDAKEFERPKDYTVKDFSELMNRGRGN